MSDPLFAKAEQRKIDDRLWSSKVRNLSPYVPGEQPKHENLCKLNTNENPFPPSPKVVESISQVLTEQASSLRLYPEPESNRLRATIARVYGVEANQVFVGNGSDEVLAFIFYSFFKKDRPLLTPDIGYSFYPVYAETFDVNLVHIPLQDDLSVNPDDYRQPCGGIIIANPNAPTGLLMPLSHVEKLCNEHPNAVIVIDEAYIDFAVIDDQLALAGDAPSAVSLIKKYDNLVVTQTFSKSRSLAGLRVGMAFANSSLIEALTRIKNSFNSYPLDKLAQIGAITSLLDIDYFTQVRENIVELRTALIHDLRQLGFEVLESQTNFVFAKPPEALFDGFADVLASMLREQGIIVRHFDKPRIQDYLRITVGTAEQNQTLLYAIREMFA